VYGRDYAGRTLQFEASGGLTNSSLVMQDRQTDSYWSLMKGKAVAGKLSGTMLRELPVSKKARFGDWVAEHPNTLVLSIGGVEDVAFKPYADYFASARGFRGQAANDTRLPTKEPIFAFHLHGKSYAVSHASIEGGHVFALPGGQTVFLYRAKHAPMFESSAAYLGGDFVRIKDNWRDKESGCVLNANHKGIEGKRCPAALPGFDTFWYNWSLNNPSTALLR